MLRLQTSMDTSSGSSSGTGEQNEENPTIIRASTAHAFRADPAHAFRADHAHAFRANAQVQKTTKSKINFKLGPDGLFTAIEQCPLCTFDNPKKKAKALRCRECRRFFHLQCIKESHRHQDKTWKFNNELIKIAIENGFFATDYVCHLCDPQVEPIALELHNLGFVTSLELVNFCQASQTLFPDVRPDSSSSSNSNF